MMPGDAIENAIRERYRKVAHEPAGHFVYPVGRESALGLGYEAAWLAQVPSGIVDRFVGVGCPFGIHLPERGARVLDLGCGCGLDLFVAAMLVGAGGKAVGIDLSAEMLAWPRRHLSAWEPGNVEVREASVARMPFADESFDLAISNGALNLVPDKDAAFAEVFRVLAPGGRFAVADLLVVDTVPEEVLADPDAWST